MTLNIQLPAELENNLRTCLGDLDRIAKEAFLVELYRQDRITQFELSQALGLERLEVDALLKKYNVTEDLPTRQEVEDEVRRLAELVNK